MIRFLLPFLALSALPAAATDGSEIALPSGQTVTWIDTINDAPGPDGLAVRFRFLAPAIARDGGTVSSDQAQEDMQVLCDKFALPRIPSTGPQPSQIIISLSDRKTEFGVPDPDATQYFESYGIEDGACIWEVF
jgi:hypothetical protein